MLSNYCKKSHYISICNSYNAYDVPRQSSRTNNADGWYKTALSWGGGGGGGSVCSLLRAKGFTWIPTVGHVLVLAPRFDSEFVMIFQEHGWVRGKNSDPS